MESKIATAIALRYPPVALIWSEQKPEDVVQFKEQKWGCIMWFVSGAPYLAKSGEKQVKGGHLCR